MKWIVLVVLLGLIGPLTMMFRSNPRYVAHGCFFMGFLVFFLDPYLNIAPYTWYWSGPVKGIELSILDVIALAIILSTRRIRIPLAIKAGFFICLLALFISTFNSGALTATAFYIVQFLRAVLVFVAVARASAAQPNAPIALAAGLGLAISIEAVLAAKQYLGGNQAPGGTLDHRNILGLTSHFAIMPAFALLLAGKRAFYAAIVVICGAVIALSGGGRATIGLYAIGLVVTTAYSMRHRMTGRKGALAGLAVLALVLAFPAMMWAIDRRSPDALISSNEERHALITAARMIIADHPFGVGGNQYVLVANTGGYSDRAGVAWNYGSRAAPVHNSYYLVTAEFGFIGLFGLISLFVGTLAVGIRALRRMPNSERAELLVGFLGALTVVTVHIGFEWLLQTSYIHYLLAMNMGALVGIAVSATSRSRASVRSPIARQPAVMASEPA